MNKIYKVMYSKVKQCCVVVSEIAKSHGHNGESSSVRKHAALMAAVLIALGSFSFTTAFVPMTAEAANKTDGSHFVGVERTDGVFDDSDYANHNGKGAHGDDSITVGLKAIGGDGTITIGDRSADKSLGSVYVGRGPGMPTGKVLPDKTDDGYWATSVGYQSDATGYGSIAIGSNATANNSYDKDSTGHGIILKTTSGDGKTVVLNGKPDIQRASVAIGYGANADNGNIAIGSYSDASTDLRTVADDTAKAYLTDKKADSYVSVGKTGALRRISNVADGAADSDAATISQLKKAVEATDASKKANIDATNIGKNLKYKADGKTAADSSDITTNEDAWGAAIGTGKVADPTKSEKNDPAKNGSQQLVTGGTVYNALQQQKTDLTNDLSVNAGWGINIAKTKDNKIISLDRNLGKDLDTSRNNVTVNDTGLILGGVNNDGDRSLASYGATGQYAVTVGGSNAYASGTASIAVGGSENTASGEYATVSGGTGNKAVGGVSAVYGGWVNTAFGTRTAIMGGRYNEAFGEDSVANGGQANIAYGSTSTVVGGNSNFVGGDTATSIGGRRGVVNGAYSVGILGGSTSIDAPYTLAAGYHSVVTGTGLSSRDMTEEEYEEYCKELSQGKLPASVILNGKVFENFATAIGDKATADAPQTISFGHDKGDVSGYKIIWKEREDGKLNPDGTLIDYQDVSIQETTYDSAYYNRLVKAADGIEDHDAVVMEQLKNASGVGSKIKVYQTDENGNIKFDKNNNPIEDTSDSDAVKTKREAAQKASEDAWGKAIGTGKIADPTKSDTNDPEANGSQQLVTGGTVYSYNKPVAVSADKPLKYVKEGKTTGENLGILDATLNDKNHNIKYYAVDETTLPKLTNFNGKDYSNEKNDGAKGMGSIAAGFNTHADGIASTVAGSYSGVLNQDSKGAFDLRGATALSYGTFNVNQNAAQAGTFSGVANSIVGQANVTTDSNAAIIYGAGNTVKNSYRDIDTKNASEIRAAAGSRDVTKLSEALQKAVPTSGGQVMVMGGGNSVDKAYMTQVTGVGNKVTGTQTWSDEEKADNSGVTQLNFIDGFYSSLENGHNDYMIGAYNKLKDSDSTIIFGDNNGQKFFASSNDSKPQKDNINFVNVKDSIAIGSNNNFISKADKAHGSLEDVVAVGNNNTVSGSSHAIAIGDQNTIHNGEAWQGDPKSINSSGNVAIGYNTKIWYDATYGSDGESIVIGKNASAYNPVGTLEKTFNFGNEDLKNQKSGFTGSIAIGENAFARSGSTTIGVHRYKGTLGDINVDPTSTPSGYSGNNGVGNSMLSSNATTVGNETYNNGVFSTAMGSYTSLSGLYSHQKWGEKYYGLQNFGAAVIGSLDSVESLTSTQGTAGMADSILGSANRTQNANGTVMVGAGNVVTNSAVEFGADEIKTAGSENPNKLSEAMRTSIKNANGGGAASVIGNGNIVDSSTSVSVVGAKNEVYNTKNAQILASNRTIGTKTPDTTSTGDATIEVKAVENSVIIGSASVDSPVTTTKSNVTILGYNANAEVDDGVALGSESVARTGAGDAGYDPTTGKGSEDNSIAWTATRAAVSIGNTDEKVTDKVTRQLTGLAAGTNDTDAVNVAQLRKLGDNTVQYDLNTDKGKITLAGKSGTTITNVKSALDGAKDAEGKDATIATATGDALKNAANLSDLQKVYKEVNEKADKASASHTALTVEGGTSAGTKDEKTKEDVYAGKNILLHESTDENGKVTYDLKLAKDINIGKPGKDGEDGKIGIDGKDGHIGLNGSDGITVRGLDGKDGTPGKDGVTITGPKGEAGKDGIDGKVGISGTDGKDAVSISGKDGVGHIGLTGPAGTNGMNGADGKPGTSIDITVKNGYDDTAKGINGTNGVDGKDGITRIVYTDKTGEHQVATMEDGLKFKGDDTKVIAKKLNNTMEIIGGANSENLTDGNIGVNSTKDNQLKVQLAKDLKGITSISNQKTTKVEGKDVTTGAKIDLGDDGSVDVNNGKITHVGSGIEKDKAGNLTEASKANAANIGDVQNIVKDAVDSASETTNKALAGKANIDASNIGANLKGADGNAASAEDQKANAEKWGSAIGTGEIKEKDGRMVTGKTVFEYNKPIAEDGKKLNYVSKDKTTGQNLGALDSHVKTNADAIQNITNNVQNLSDNAVQYDKDTNKTKVTLGGGEGGTTITNVKAGDLSDKSTDAVNGKQLYAEQQARKELETKVTSNTTEINNIKDGKGFTEAGKTVIKNWAQDAVQVKAGDRIKVDEETDKKTGNKTYTISANNNGKVAKDDGNLISGDTLYKEVHVDKDGTYIKSKDSATDKDMTVAQNLSALDKGLKTTSDLIHTNDKGDIQIGGSSTATKIDVSGKDAKGNTTGRFITGVVTDAGDPTSAANVGYVNGVTAANTQQIYRDMNNAYGRLNNNINKAAAGSNALAALHPLDYDPDDKADFAVGYGHYRNANAAAVGAFYHPNENTMVNVGVSLGNGDPGFNAGVSFKIGSGRAGRQAMSKTEMAKVINSQSKEIDALKKDNADKDKRIDALEQKMAEILAKLDKNGK